MGFVANRRKGAWIQGARSEGDAGIFKDMSRGPNKRNAVETQCIASLQNFADAVESHEISGLSYSLYWCPEGLEKPL